MKSVTFFPLSFLGKNRPTPFLYPDIRSKKIFPSYASDAAPIRASRYQRGDQLSIQVSRTVDDNSRYKPNDHGDTNPWLIHDLRGSMKYAVRQMCLVDPFLKSRLPERKVATTRPRGAL